MRWITQLEWMKNSQHNKTVNITAINRAPPYPKTVSVWFSYLYSEMCVTGQDYGDWRRIFHIQILRSWGIAIRSTPFPEFSTPYFAKVCLLMYFLITHLGPVLSIVLWSISSIRAGRGCPFHGRLTSKGLGRCWRIYRGGLAPSETTLRTLVWLTQKMAFGLLGVLEDLAHLTDRHDSSPATPSPQSWPAGFSPGCQGYYSRQ